MIEYYSSDRRKFIRQLGLSGIAISILPSFSWMDANELEQEGLTRLVILHTNDMHSHIDPFPSDHSTFPGLGGMSARLQLIESIRRTEKQVILLDAGDIFQGTPYFNYYGGEPEFKLMSQMGYDAVTMGNHDFDNGLDGFLRVLPHARFPFVCSNYDFSETLLINKTLKNTVLIRDHIKIGIFGLGVELEGLVMKKNYGKTVWIDPVKVCEQQVDELRNNQRCDLVICLSHLGYSYSDNKISDIKLAQVTSGIDIILGGHTHTFLPEAILIKNKEGKATLINQVGWAGVKLGRIDLLISKTKSKKKDSKDITYIGGENKNID